MKLVLDGPSALAALRAIRCGALGSTLPSERTDLPAPNPAPSKRWVKRAVTLGELQGVLPFSDDHPLHVAVPSKETRIRSSFMRSTVYERGLPDGSFVPIDNELLVPCPELLFLTMDRHMDPLPHLMLGLELCGSFSRDALDPLGGTAHLHLTPITSANAICSFAERAGLRGHDQAHRLAACLADDAWSPGEALVAAFAGLPFLDLGYGLGPIALNRRQEPDEELTAFATRSSRVPDILLAGSRIGINYDGEGHLDLDALVMATSELDRHPESASVAKEFERTRRKVREKYVDDRRRDRELGAAGVTVFVATKEDLYEPGAFDRLMGQCTYALRQQGVQNLDHLLQGISSKAIARIRQEMLDSVLVGRDKPGILI